MMQDLQLIAAGARPLGVYVMKMVCATKRRPIRLQFTIISLVVIMTVLSYVTSVN